MEGNVINMNIIGSPCHCLNDPLRITFVQVLMRRAPACGWFDLLSFHPEQDGDHNC